MSEASSATSTESSASSATDTVSKADHERALADLKKFKSERDTLATETSDLKARLEALEKSKSESSGDFKSMYEREKTAREELNGKYEGLKKNVVRTEKYKAASQALLKAGMTAEAMKMLDKEDFTEIEVEATTQGRFITHGVDLYVDKFKKEFPFAFGTGKPPVINGGGGGSGDTTTEELTPKRLYEIEVECKKKGDMKPYHEALKQFAEQKKKKIS